MPKYLPRILDTILKHSLDASGAVLIEGPKWCGKTSTANHIAKSTLYMQDPDMNASYLKAADIKPSLLLQGNVPRLLDEWQVAPVLWDAVRFEVDKRNKTGQFILTGSSVPKDNVTSHTGTGRISRLLMRTMSLYESKDSNGSVSLESLFNGINDIASFSNLTIENIAYLITRGGWPASIKTSSEKIALKQISNYVESVINQDISKVDGIEKNPNRVRQLLKSLSRNISTMATMKTIKNDMAENEMTLSEKTISQYLNALRRIYVIEDLPAWTPSLRSKTSIRTSAKRHFVDPSIATAVLRLNNNTLLHDFETFGLLFESLCIRDLRIYAQSLDGEVYHYHDKNGLEADGIIWLHDGRWAAVEVKMGSKEIENAAKNLIKLAKNIDTKKMQKPSFLMILTGTELAYKRNDGVYVIPLGCLKP
jgi:predicted AAA+ superfamily ATPase